MLYLDIIITIITIVSREFVNSSSRRRRSLVMRIFD